MKKIIVSTLIFIQIISAVALAGGGLKYSISEIPDSLKKNANSVLRVSETTFHVYDDFKALNTVMYAVTLLNSKSLDDAKIRVFYDNNSSVNYLKFKIYNAIGEDITHSFKTLDVADEI